MLFCDWWTLWWCAASHRWNRSMIVDKSGYLTSMCLLLINRWRERRWKIFPWTNKIEKINRLDSTNHFSSFTSRFCWSHCQTGRSSHVGEKNSFSLRLLLIVASRDREEMRFSCWVIFLSIISLEAVTKICLDSIRDRTKRKEAPCRWSREHAERYEEKQFRKTVLVWWWFDCNPNYHLDRRESREQRRCLMCSMAVKRVLNKIDDRIKTNGGWHVGFFLKTRFIRVSSGHLWYS